MTGPPTSKGDTVPRMIGRKCPDGPGGRDCPCCGQAPGKDRKRVKRARRRSERQQWKGETR